MAGPASRAVSAWMTVRDEVSGVLSAVSDDQMSGAAALFTDRGRRWFCSGQGRSGLVAQMVAMRLMHTGFDAHAVGEPTSPSIGEGDGLVMISGSGETPVTLHFARLALGFGAWMRDFVAGWQQALDRDKFRRLQRFSQRSNRSPALGDHWLRVAHR